MGRGKSMGPVIFMALAMGGIGYYYYLNRFMINHNTLLQFIVLGALAALFLGILVYLVT
jgi:hypothetical protein